MSVPASDHKQHRSSGWIELASATAGLGLVWMSLDRMSLDIASIPVGGWALLATGALLVAWGARRFVRWLLLLLAALVRPWGTAHYRLHFQREAYLYTLMLLVICVGSLLGGSSLLLLVFGLMAGPFIVGGQITLLVLRHLRITRVLPEVAVAGQRFSVRVRLANRKPLLSAWMIVAADTVANDREELHPAVLFTRVPPRSEREGMYSIHPARRGLYRFGPMRVTCGFPLGLVARSFELGQSQRLVVYPRIGRLTSGWYEVSRRGSRVAERVLTGVGVCDEEFHRLREYRSGDNPRAIHWRTTARRNALMVREYLHHHNPELWLVLDLWQPDHPTAEDLERVERAVSFAATVCAEQSRSSGDVDLQLVICGRGHDRLTWSREAQPLQSLLSRLALAEAGPALELAHALETACRRTDDQARRVLVSTRPAPEALRHAVREGPGGAVAESALGTFQVVYASTAGLADIFLENGAIAGESG